jgi:hypothetical protein
MKKIIVLFVLVLTLMSCKTTKIQRDTYSYHWGSRKVTEKEFNKLYNDYYTEFIKTWKNE